MTMSLTQSRSCRPMTVLPVTDKDILMKPAREPGTQKRPPVIDNPIPYKPPKALHTLILNDATLRGVSIAEVLNSAVENEFARRATYTLNWYDEILPLVQKAQGQRGITSNEKVIRAV